MTRSGTLNVRMPADLHDHLAIEAQKQGVSLNMLIVSLLAGGSRFKLMRAQSNAPSSNLPMRLQNDHGP